MPEEKREKRRGEETKTILNERSDIQGSVDLQLVDLPAGRDYKVVTANGWETRFLINAFFVLGDCVFVFFPSVFSVLDKEKERVTEEVTE